MARSVLWLLAGVASSMLFACTTSDDGATAGSDYSGPVIGGSDTGSDDGGGTGSDGGGDGSGSGSDTGGGTSTGGGGDGMTGTDGQTGDAGIALTTGCSTPEASDVYSPFIGKTVSRGAVTAYPWRGVSSTYPDSVEDFRGYSGLPTQIECGSNKSARDYVDVTAGCLDAVSSGGNAVGQIHGTTDGGYYRSFALANDPVHHRPAAWTDMVVEYSFFYSQWTGNVSGPGFKIFARYLTEYDLYVGSWRMDGTAQIQKKQCGVYTILKRNGSYGAPAPNMWHTVRFEVVGNTQKLYLDGNLAISTTDDSIKSGTAGIRIDSAEGALIDNWSVTAP